jgi:two-component system sensor kinase FixL
MNWINFLWPMVTGACLTLALVHLGTGLRGTARKVNLMFAFLAFLMAVYSVIELGRMHVYDRAEYLEWQRWQDIVGAASAVTMALFIWVYFGTTRRWLGVLAIVVTFVSLIPNMGPTPRLVFLELTRIEAVTTFGGATFAFAEGINNPWNPVYYLGIALLLVFIVDASITYSRGGGQRRAALVGWTIALALLIAGLHAYFVDEGILRMPYIVSVTWLLILIAMAWELSNDQLRAIHLARELGQTQEQMSLAAEAAELIIWEWDTKQDNVWMNAVGRQLFALGPSTPMNLRRLLQTVHPEDRALVQQQIAQALESATELEMEYHVVAAGNRTHWMLTRGRLYRDDKGQPVLLRAVSLDVTERKRDEDERAELRRVLGHFNRVMQMSELSSSLAHEINQPLGAILNNVAAARTLANKHEARSEEMDDILQDIGADAERASQVVRNIRAMARHEDIVFERLSVNSIIEEIVGLARSSLREHQVSLTMNLQPGLVPIRGNRIGLQQVLLNLINNAQEAMRESPSKILTVSSSMKSADDIVVCVNDTGTGLDAAARVRVFSPYFTTKKEGMGIGLRICQSIVEEHGGQIWFEGKAGGGATVCFSIPVFRGNRA